jgi:hypothetical protein
VPLVQADVRGTVDGVAMVVLEVVQRLREVRGIVIEDERESADNLGFGLAPRTLDHALWDQIPDRLRASCVAPDSAELVKGAERV